jgi:hypothetical protein
MIRQLCAWFCRNRRQLMRWSLTLAAVAPLAAWGISKAFAIDARSVVVVIGAALFILWRPYRDSWLRRSCTVRTRACVSH